MMYSSFSWVVLMKEVNESVEPIGCISPVVLSSNEMKKSPFSNFVSDAGLPETTPLMNVPNGSLLSMISPLYRNFTSYSPYPWSSMYL